MTREELIARLEDLGPADDGRAVMDRATGLLLGFLIYEGYGDVTKAFMRLMDRLLPGDQS